MKQPAFVHGHTIQRVATIGCVLLYSLSFMANSSPIGVEALRGDINRALISGNLAAIDTLATQHPEVPQVVFDVARARIRYDLEASSTDAKLCEAALESSEPKIAFYCARLFAGNLRLEGKLREAAREELNIAQRYAEKLSSKDLANPDLAHANDLIDLPLMTKQIPGETFSVPLLRDRKGHMTTRLNVDDVNVNFIVDTAAYTILSAETAKAVHAHVVQEEDGTAYGASGYGAKKKLAIVDTLKIGEATLHNLPVAVADIGIDVVGLDVLRFVAPVRVSKNAMRFYPGGRSAPECDQALTIGAPPWGANPQLISYQMVNGDRHSMALDTGSIFFLTGTKRAESFANGPPVQIQMGDLTARSRTAVYLPGSGTLTLAGVEHALSFMILPAYDLNYDFLIGNRALDEVDFFIDFDHRHFCVIGNEAKRAAESAVRTVMDIQRIR